MASATATRRREVMAWACYDWANSAYTTLAITVLVAYIQRVVFPSESWGTTGAVVWAWGISLSMLCGALLSPVIGAMADARANKRLWLGGTALVGATAVMLLAVIPETWYVLIVALFFTGNLMLELSLGVYNAFLPEIADEADYNRVSAWGYGLGYVGGGLALALVMLVLSYGHLIGLADMPSRLRLGLGITGAWWAIFTLPAIFVLRDRANPGSSPSPAAHPVRRAITDVATTLRNLSAFSSLAVFLLAFLLYNDGVQTVISQSSTFALQDLQFTEAELAGVILMIQFLAMPGAIAIGALSERLGQRWTLLWCLVIWSGVICAALVVHTKLQFWILGAVIALVLGGTQSVSRAAMSVMTPPSQAGQFFGFFNLTGKATSFIGAFLFGAIIAITGSPRLAIFGILPFFLIGAALIWRLDIRRGVEQREAAERTT